MQSVAARSRRGVSRRALALVVGALAVLLALGLSVPAGSGVPLQSALDPRGNVETLLALAVPAYLAGAFSLLSPVRYYVDFGYQVLFKGNGLGYVWLDVAGILALGVALFLLSVRRFARLVR